MIHEPVLLEEVIGYLNPKKGDVILDATINGGGHATAICKQLGPTGRLIGIEQDSEILKATKNRMSDVECGINLINGNFRNLDEILESLKIKKMNGALFDLGMSSVQLEESGRGFSFQKNEPLLMTFKSEPEVGDLTARDILNEWTKEEIYEILKNYGEERYAGRISRSIVEHRKIKSFETTDDLVAVIKNSVPPHYLKGRISPATRTFQALRIAVNDELNVLSEALEKSWEFIDKNGRLVVVSFHSLEDRIVKNFLKSRVAADEGRILTKKPLGPSEEERLDNPRSRSAKLRAVEKL